MLFLFEHCTDEKRMQQCLLTLMLAGRTMTGKLVPMRTPKMHLYTDQKSDFDVRCKEVGVWGNSAVAFHLTRHSSGLSCSSVSGRAQLQSTKRSSPDVHIPPLELDDLLQHLGMKKKTYTWSFTGNYRTLHTGCRSCPARLAQIQNLI